MALFQPISGNLSGSIGGNTYSHNKGGAYVRRRSVPVNPTSARQTAVRAIMSTNSRAWNGLTAAQRAAWSVYANANPTKNRLGVSVKSSGISIFNKINNVSRDSGNGAVTNAPAGVGPAAPVSVSVSTNTPTTATLSFSPSPLGANVRLAVWWTGPGRASQDPNAKQARLIAYTAVNPSTALVVPLPAAVSAGNVSNFYIGTVDSTGRTSPLTKVRYTFV